MYHLLAGIQSQQGRIGTLLIVRIRADRLAEYRLVTLDIQNIILNLERQSEIARVLLRCPGFFIVRTAPNTAEGCRRTAIQVLS